MNQKEKTECFISIYGNKLQIHEGWDITMTPMLKDKKAGHSGGFIIEIKNNEGQITTVPVLFPLPYQHVID